MGQLKKLGKKAYIKGSYWGTKGIRMIKSILGRTLMIFSIFLFFLILFTSVAKRVPVFNFFVRESKLPVVYSIEGKIEFVKYNEENREDINIENIEIVIGGYSENINNAEKFIINFTGTNDENIPVIIKYKVNGLECQKIKYISFDKYENSKKINLMYYY